MFITELKDKNDKNIFVPVTLDVRGSAGMVCKINSIYGKNNLYNYIQKAINNGGISAYNTKKADKLFTDIGCQSSKSASVICYDDTMAYTTAHAKYPKKEKCEGAIF